MNQVGDKTVLNVEEFVIADNKFPYIYLQNYRIYPPI